MKFRDNRGKGLGAGVCAALAISIALLATSTVWAQDGFDVQLFQPMPSQQTNYLNLASGRVMTHLDFEAGFLVNYAEGTLVLTNAGEPLVAVVDQQMMLDVHGAIGLFDWLQLGFVVPVALLQDGEHTGPIRGAPNAGAGIGDIRFVPHIRLTSTEYRGGITKEGPAGITAGFLVNTWIPIGSSDDFQGEGFRIEPRLALDYGFPMLGRRSSIGANVGYLVRPESTYFNIEVDDALTFGGAASIGVTDWLYIVPEVAGQMTVIASSIDEEEVPVEGLLGLKFYPIPGLLIEAGGGAGLTAGYGTPKWRAFFGVSYSPVPVHDADEDGIEDGIDECPENPEDFDQYLDEDGCPDPDNDNDGVLDIDDDCPDVPEDWDEFEDEDGCPDNDNDEDEVLDVDDACPLDPEDIDLWEDDDGCPDNDNDNDYFTDDVDECPNEPETYNDLDDEDGCPDEILVMQVICERIELHDTVHFDTDSADIKDESDELLDQIADMLNTQVDIRRIRVEGHTDERGTEEHNMDLSQRRAEAVVEALIDRGVDESRLMAQGFGESVPFGDNTTPAGRAQNRRVELLILDQEGCPFMEPPY